MTSIEWTRNADGSQGKSWNPVVGCSLASPGCTNCYAMKMAARIDAIDEAAYRKRVEAAVAVAEDRDAEERIRATLNNERVISHYAGLTTPSKAGPVYNGKVALAPERTLTEPLRRKKPTTWFVNSMGDLFHEAVPDSWIDRVFAVMALCPQHTFIVLTKRSDRMRAHFHRATTPHFEPCEDGLDDETAPTEWAILCEMVKLASDKGITFSPPILPLHNVWLGVSAERQLEANERIPDLLATPATLRLVSAEPLLGAINFDEASKGCLGARPMQETWETTGLGWIIVGGESGSGARPMHPDWAREIRDQCAAAGVPFFFKQWGNWAPELDRDKDDQDCRANYRRYERNGFRILNLAGGCGFHGDRVHVMRPSSKSSAGRLLDGRTHDAMPAQRQTETV